MKNILFAVLLLVAASAATPIDNRKLHLVTKLRPTSDRISKHGYPVEEHSVETTDGYVIKVFRIPYSHKLENKDAVKPAVLLQHGLLSCSDMWIANGPNDALPYLLADMGYDVWLGNSRGNNYGRSNTQISPDNQKFWEFSWHEIGLYDVSAMIDYILSETNQKAVHYVGHSQGTSVFFVLMSVRPEYNAKIKTAHMLAPMGYVNHTTNSVFDFLAPFAKPGAIFNLLIDNVEFLPHNEKIMLILYNACGEDGLFPKICSKLGTLIASKEAKTNMTALTTIFETHPAGISSNQLLHYLEEMRSGHFRQFDYGTTENIAKYNQSNPPDYEVENISSEVYLYYSDSDTFSAVEDVLGLAARLSTATLHHVPDPSFTHLDFALGLEVKELINDPVIERIESFENPSK